MLSHMNMNGFSALFLRLVLAYFIIMSGYPKVMNMDGTIASFINFGFPGFTAYLVGYGEVLAFFGLVLGLYARLASLLLLPILIGAIYLHLTVIPSPPHKAMLLGAISISIYLTGPGFMAVRRVPFIDKFMPSFLRDY